jgi:dihydropyrimidine dehydrogenase (NAD+) subunit PreA
MKKVKTAHICKDEAARCLLCHDAPCSAACPHGQKPGEFIRAVRFERGEGALEHMSGCRNCAGESCQKACIHYDHHLRIKAMRDILGGGQAKAFPKADLSVNFLGVKCENPFFLASSVIASNYEMCARALKMGWGGIVFKTIGCFTPKEVSPRFEAVGKEGTPFIGFRNLEQISDHPYEENFKFLKELKRDFPSKVIVSSIMGSTDEEWTLLAKLSEEAGCDIVECNFSCPHMSGNGLGSDVGQDPALVKHYAECVKKGTKLPILAKMTPNIGNMEIPARAALEGGADGIAAINTIKSITGLNLTELSAPPAIKGKSSVSGYSGKAVKPIALRFVHDLAVDQITKTAPISGIGGIETWKDAAEFIMLGCANVQVTTAVMQYGYRIIDDLTSGLSAFMAKEGYKSVGDLVGKALPNIIPAEKLDRDTVQIPYVKEDLCVKCGRCYISCLDAGHQAISWDKKERRAEIIKDKCEGCHLCVLVCPVQALAAGERRNK